MNRCLYLKRQVSVDTTRSLLVYLPTLYLMNFHVRKEESESPWHCAVTAQVKLMPML